MLYLSCLKNSKIKHEFRTTFEPNLSVYDIEKISKIVGNNQNYFLQKYNPPNDRVIKIPHSKADFDEALARSLKNASLTRLRGF